MNASSAHSSSESSKSGDENESGKLGLSLFEGVGIELEYMIVHRDSLEILPVSDRVLEAEAGHIVSDVEHEDISWSNELVLHVIELKTNSPVPSLAGVAESFQAHVERVNASLAPLGGRLMPTAMHPWMNPAADTHLWPHHYGEIYNAFARIFGCRTHGWSNLQSLHINLPFAGDEEFGRLHAAIRLLLPILPAIAASSPIVSGSVTGLLDNRLDAYRSNCARIPCVTGNVIPEPVFMKAAYEEQILQPIYHQLAPHDPERILQYEWVNARGAVARFDRDTIEIRLIDMQECPAADLAVVAAVVSVLKLLVSEKWSSYELQKAPATDALAEIFNAAVRHADAARIDNLDYLRLMGWLHNRSCTMLQLWRYLVETARAEYPEDMAFCEEALRRVFERGALARRMLGAIGKTPSRTDLTVLYGRLCDCLNRGEMFVLEKHVNGD